MSDKEQILDVYHRLYSAMIAKDSAELQALFSNDGRLEHMTGLVQSKQDFIKAIENGTLNYFSVRHENEEITVEDSSARLNGRSRVLAAVYGGGKHEWPLLMKCTLKKKDGDWKIVYSKVSTYYGYKSSERSEKLRTDTIADAKEKKHKKHHSDGWRDFYPDLTDDYTNDKGSGNCAERKRLVF